MKSTSDRRWAQQEEKIWQLEVMQVRPAQGVALLKEMLEVLLRVHQDLEFNIMKTHQ